MLRNRHVSDAAANDSTVSPVAATLPHLQKPLAFENPINLPCRQDPHG